VCAQALDKEHLFSEYWEVRAHRDAMIAGTTPMGPASGPGGQSFKGGAAGTSKPSGRRARSGRARRGEYPIQPY
jgi:hypothetical protein